MTTELSRRDLLRGALAGGVLCVAASLAPGCAGDRRRMVQHAEATGELAPNVFITILASGVVVLQCVKAEMGQGVTTGYATLVAEELEVEPLDIDVRFADSSPEFRTWGKEIPMFAAQATGNSTSIAEGYLPLRRAAAAAREMLVAAAAGTWKVPAQTCVARGGRVHHEPSGRSFGYGELTRAAARRGVPADPVLKERRNFRVIGKPGIRVDARAKSTGATKFGIDGSVPDMVCAHVIHGPRYDAHPRIISADAAKRSPGVIDVLAMRWGVVVVAAKYWQALRAAPLVEIEWKGGTQLDTEELARAAARHTGGGSAIRDDGDAPKALRRSGLTAIEAVYETPHLAHAPMEPQNCIVAVRGDHVEVWAPTQSPTVIQESVADALGVASSDVLVHTTFAGGGFGRRFAGDYAAQTAQVARAVRRPVKLMFTRESDMTQGLYRPAAFTRVIGAVDAHGGAEALHYHSLSQPLMVSQLGMVRGGMPGWMPDRMRDISARSMLALTAANTATDVFAVEGAADTPYRISNVRVEYTPVATEIPVGFWRSTGHSFNGFVMESAIDELAHAARQDPLSFRLAHLATGSRERRVLEAVAELAGWKGSTGGAVPAGHAWGIARHSSFSTEVAEIAEVTVVDGRIRVTRVWCTVDCGIAINPDVIRALVEGAIVFGLSAALDQEITIRDGVVQQTNFDSYPLLRMHECPRIEVQIIDSSANPTGVGEATLPPVAPAVANAVFALTGKRLRRLPLQHSFTKASSK